jgi:hypothetical protein
MAGSLVSEIADVKAANMEVCLFKCSKAGCASVKASGLVEISTRCLNGQDHLCGNEDTFYPPLTEIQNPAAVFTELSAYRGDGLNMTWESTGQRNAYLGRFSL